MTDFLVTIVDAKRQEVADRRRRRSLESLRDPAQWLDTDAPRDLRAALSTEGLSVIAEIKRQSPSKGPLRPAADVPSIACAYELNGARAVSVLTDREFFGGSDEDLAAARGATCLPILRKDFTVDAYQIHEARAIGADAVLLIARVLLDSRLPEWIGLCSELSLTPLVEVHDEEELAFALEARAPVIGINSRDLRTFQTDLARAVRLRPLITDGTLAVAESGIHTPADVETIREADFDACLVGESLMTAPDPGESLRALLQGETRGTS